MAGQVRKRYSPEFKLKVVLESLQQGTTQEEVCRRFGISNSLLHKWREEFLEKAVTLFLDQRNPKNKAQVEGHAPGESPDELKKIIENLRQEIDILKKAQGLLGR